MENTRPDAWFYSHKGERIGPVTFVDLQAKAKEGELNPRLDMAWTHGMDEWKASGEIEGLFARTVAEPRELAPPSDPYSPPPQESVKDRMGREGDWPGVGRKAFLAAMIFFPILWSVGLVFVTPVLDAQFGPHIMSVFQLAAPPVPLLVLIIVTVKRFANLGMSRWWCLGMVIPILNSWLGYRCLACPAGYAFHKKLGSVGIFLAIFYWLANLLVILVLCLTIGIWSGAIGSPELRKTAIDAYRDGMERKRKEIEDARHK